MEVRSTTATTTRLHIPPTHEDRERADEVAAALRHYKSAPASAGAVVRGIARAEGIR